jgi:hypothetical protein
MSSIAVAAIAFGCTLLAAISGGAMRRRLPEHHLSTESRELLKLVMSLIATVAALVLGLLISSAHRSYDEQENEVQQLGIHLFQLDRALERFGPETADARRLLRTIVASEIQFSAALDAAGAGNRAPLQAQAQAAELFDKVANLAPKTDGQRFMQAQALRLLSGLGDIRLLLNEQARGSISWPFLVVLVFWLTVLFLGFGLFAPGNATVVGALFLGALCVAGALFLILELNRPYAGVMQISIAPIQNALTQIDR